MRWGILFALVFLIGGVSASSVTSTIVGDKVLVEIELTDGAKIVLDLNGHDSGEPPEEYSLLEIDGTRVSFISKDFVRHDGEWIFALPVVVTGAYDLEVVLPSGFVLSDGLVYPKGYDIGSDGKSIILKWESVDEEVIVFYEGVEDSYAWVWILIFCLVVAGILFWKFEKRKFLRELERLKGEAAWKKKVVREENVSRNLFGEEKKIAQFLLEKKSCWMKDLVRELGISKVMVTRKVRSLAQKGIVKGEKMGREMRISLVKGNN